MAKISIQDISKSDRPNQIDGFLSNLTDAELSTIQGGGSPYKGWKRSGPPTIDPGYPL
jgi:hypothetical protein